MGLRLVRLVHGTSASDARLDTRQGLTRCRVKFARALNGSPRPDQAQAAATRLSGHVADS